LFKPFTPGYKRIFTVVHSGSFQVESWGEFSSSLLARLFLERLQRQLESCLGLSFALAPQGRRRRSSRIDTLFARQAQQCAQKAPVKNVSLIYAKAMDGVYPLPVTHSTEMAPFCPFRPIRHVFEMCSFTNRCVRNGRLKSAYRRRDPWVSGRIRARGAPHRFKRRAGKIAV
jgi:hypothetical protein